MPGINCLYRKSRAPSQNNRHFTTSRSYSIDSGRHASDVLEIGASEYTVTFADEWETDGRRFGSGTFAIWFLGDDDDTYICL